MLLDDSGRAMLAIFGLFGCMLLILIAKAMGIIIVVDEDYYQEESR